MSNLRTQFEKELKNKLSLKSSGYTTEETVLLKAFKYFDLDNSGVCSKKEFIKAINKIGITGLSEENLEDLFDVYDVDGSGELDYKEFVGIIFNNASMATGKKSNQQSAKKPQAEPKSQAGKNADNKQDLLDDEQVQDILLRVRDKIAARGTRGITSIAKYFAIIDDDNSHFIDFEEFKKACKDFRFDLTNEEMEIAFDAFDVDGTGKLEYDDFLRTIVGPMNDFRKGIVEKVYNMLDRDQSGVLDINDIKDIYNASRHPDVLSGKKTEDEVLLDFLETFEANHNYLNGTQSDGKVTLDEFIEYYENVSMSIDDDAYFEAMMNACWKLGNTPNYADKKAWSNKNETAQEPNVADNYRQKFGDKEPQQPQEQPEEPRGRGRRGQRPQPQEQPEEPRGRGRRGQRPQPQEQPEPEREEPKNQPPQPRKQGRMLGERNAKAGTYQNAPFGTDYAPVDYTTSNNPKGMSLRGKGGRGQQREEPVNDVKNMKFSNKGDDVLVSFREQMAARGTRGIMSIRRAFMIADDDNSKTLDINEFKKFCHDYRVQLNEEEVERLFGIFDRDHSGLIDYDEFIRNVVGEMSDFRLNIVKKCFNKLDKNNNGQLEVDDIKGTYNASNHPDVLSGKKTEDEVLAEFLDTFEYHFSLLNMNRSRDSKITFEEFVEYYNNISMSIPDDEYFEVMMTNAYNLDNKPNYGKGWKGDY